MAKTLIYSKGLHFLFSVNDIRQLFEKSEYADMELMVVSIGGRIHLGQTFLMNLLMMYTHAIYHEPTRRVSAQLKRCKKQQQELLWWGTTEFTGYPLEQEEGAQKPIGVIMYPLMASKDGTAILFLDMEGLTKGTEMGRGPSCAILAFTIMISSVQIYNVSKILDGIDMKIMELAVLYAKLIAKRTHTDHNFQQKLMILVRDWPDRGKLPPGHVSGQQYLDLRFKQFQEEVENKRSVDHIKTFYKEIDCFLMPGLGEVWEALSYKTSNFSEVLALAGGKFHESIKEFAPIILAPGNLKVKMVQGQPVKVKDFWRYLDLLVKDLNKCKILIDISPGYNTTVLTNTMLAKEAAYFKYNQMMLRFQGRKEHISDEVLEEHHREAVNQGITEFENYPKLDEEWSAPNQKKKLEIELEELFTEYKIRNEYQNSWRHNIEELWQQYGWLTASWWWFLVTGFIYWTVRYLHPQSRLIAFWDNNYIILLISLVICSVLYSVYNTYVKQFHLSQLITNFFEI